MARPRTLRKVVAPPDFKGFKPYGVNESAAGKVELLYEEYEAIKLADYDGLNHDSAAKLMGISRPTFARIYESARQKIAVALVESKEIISIYGNVVLEKNWFICKDCQSRFTIPKPINGLFCALCFSGNIESIKI